MTRDMHDCFTRFHRVWSVALGCLLALAPLVADAQSSSLPACPRQDGYFLTASPWYAQDQTLFLVHIYPGVIWRSDDAGFSWTNLVDMSRYDGFQFGPVVVVPAVSNSGYSLYQNWAVFSDFSLVARLLWYSDDSGATWQARVPSPGHGNFPSYPTDNRNVMFALENSSPSWIPSGIWRTDNGARWWMEVWDGTEAGWLAVSPSFSQDQTLFASLSGISPELESPVIVSTDGGGTWQGAGGDDLCNEGAGSVQISSGFTEDHTLFVHQASSLFRSQDAGDTWEVVFPRDHPHCQPGVLAATADSYKLSSNFGQDHTIFMVTTGPGDDDHRLLVSEDGGTTSTFQSNLSRATSLLWVLPTAGNNDGRETHETGNSLFPGAMVTGSSVSDALYTTVPKSNWKAFLPLIRWSVEQPVVRPFTLFIKAMNPNDEITYYRSDDGGVTWACMQLPTVQPPAWTQYLGRGR